MKNYKTFSDMEALLKTTIGLPGRNIKTIAAESGIKPSTLYKWKTNKVHLTPSKADTLLVYFMRNEPERLEFADLILSDSFNDFCSLNRGSGKGE